MLGTQHSQAEKEIVVYAQRVQRMIGMAQNIVHNNSGNEFTKQFSRIEKYEEILTAWKSR